ncbi:unnamed protein product [Fraxinus pennsylvanica]|uniref:Uncharacterized protein n=1 Tax=Fraxinus pennsylvanica TaxID=56036 RepID=A0AAD2DXC5_9LAMI|nr:unnamed protein product [Fraxinus pennsylvanica]
MTLITSQEPSRTATPMRASTPVSKSPICSGPLTLLRSQNGLLDLESVQTVTIPTKIRDEVVAVLKGETMIVNKEGYIGHFMERRPGIKIDLNLPADDSQSETSNEDTADDSAFD